MSLHENDKGEEGFLYYAASTGNTKAYSFLKEKVTRMENVANIRKLRLIDNRVETLNSDSGHNVKEPSSNPDRNATGMYIVSGVSKIDEGQNGFAARFLIAALNGHDNMVEYLLNGKDSDLHEPNIIEHVGLALVCAVVNQHINVMHFLAARVLLLV